jgi:hypothetical protein
MKSKNYLFHASYGFRKKSLKSKRYRYRNSSRIQKKFIPDPDPGNRRKKHRITDLGSGSATLVHVTI